MGICAADLFVLLRTARKGTTGADHTNVTIKESASCTPRFTTLVTCMEVVRVAPMGLTNWNHKPEPSLLLRVNVKKRTKKNERASLART